MLCLLVKWSMVVALLSATVLTFVLAIVSNFGQATSNEPLVRIGTAVAFVGCLLIHRPLDRFLGMDRQ